jgi:hypothetical protein
LQRGRKSTWPRARKLGLAPSHDGRSARIAAAAIETGSAIREERRWLFDSVKRIYHVITGDATRARARIIGGGEDYLFFRFCEEAFGRSGVEGLRA